MTMPQAKITARESSPPVMLFTTVVEYKPNWREGNLIQYHKKRVPSGEETYGIDDEVVDEPGE
jgi:hypothetical protein